MVREDPYDIDDEILNKRAYSEFVMDSIDENNLKEIEKSLSKGQIDKNNKAMMIDYLLKLYRKIAEIKKQEYSYEGEDNTNINNYLMQIKTLLDKIRNI
jgi:hypothetical protein